jgi:hypothetical protein
MNVGELQNILETLPPTAQILVPCRAMGGGGHWQHLVWGKCPRCESGVDSLD